MFRNVKEICLNLFTWGFYWINTRICRLDKIVEGIDLITYNSHVFWYWCFWKITLKIGNAYIIVTLNRFMLLFNTKSKLFMLLIIGEICLISITGEISKKSLGSKARWYFPRFNTYWYWSIYNW